MCVCVCVCVCGWQYIRSPWGLSNLAKELSAAARIMQSSSIELNTLVAGSVEKCKQTDATAAVAT